MAKQKSEAVLPTRHSADPEEKKLGIWVMHQRAAAKQSGNQQIIMERKALLEAVAGWTWQAKVEKQYSDKCPKCNKVIEFATANTQNLNHEHDDGKGGTCRFQGIVIEGKIQANLRRNPWQCTGSCGRALSKNIFSAKVQNRKEGKVCKECSNAKLK